VASQLIVAGPMVVLYILSIGIAWMFGKKRVVEA
jgi:Sec-independent protein secretion pathway component TatC